MNIAPINNDKNDAKDSKGRVVLEAKSLVRSLGEKVKQVILHGIDLTIYEGQFVALTGHSGSGKSTLLYLLGVLDRPTSGQVVLDGKDTAELSDDERAFLRNEKLGFVFQFHFLLPEFTVVENVMIPMLRRGIEKQDALLRATSTLERLGLKDLAQRRPAELSGGQQQRVAVARAVAMGPRILLADEPTGNLDSRNADLVMELFRQLNREMGMTVVMVTHDTTFALQAGRQVTLKDGKILSDKIQTSSIP